MVCGEPSLAVPHRMAKAESMEGSIAIARPIPMPSGGLGRVWAEPTPAFGLRSGGGGGRADPSGSPPWCGTPARRPGRDGGEGQAAALPVPADRVVVVLEGGYPAWKRFLEPDPAEAAASPELMGLRRSLAGYFSGATGGVAPAPSPTAGAPIGGGKKKRGGGC